MAEYIKLGAIMEYCQNQRDKTISCNDLARFPTADVIEREKVNKAIDRIKGLSVHDNKIQVLKILQECIGE